MRTEPPGLVAGIRQLCPRDLRVSIRQPSSEKERHQAFGKPEGERIFRSGLEGVDRLEREITVYREDLSNPR